MGRMEKREQNQKQKIYIYSLYKHEFAVAKYFSIPVGYIPFGLSSSVR